MRIQNDWRACDSCLNDNPRTALTKRIRDQDLEFKAEIDIIPKSERKWKRFSWWIAYLLSVLADWSKLLRVSVQNYWQTMIFFFIDQNVAISLVTHISTVQKHLHFTSIVATNSLKITTGKLWNDHYLKELWKLPENETVEVLWPY